MERPISASDDPRPVLFVAREPDETLRTFLPILDQLHDRYGLRTEVLFHHTPGAWARAELSARGVPIDEVRLPARALPGPLAASRAGAAVDEIARLWKARALARQALADHAASAVVVIQDTLLLERFLVREANALGLPTLVVQWAFSYPQSMYDRLRTIQHARPGTRRPLSLPHRVMAPFTRQAYRSALRALGLGFDLVNSYGGGEADLFAVMGEAFREQFVAQGVRKRRIEVTGHPTHDAVHRRAQTVDTTERAAIRQQYGIPPGRTVVLYATQPVLWRKVISRETLQRNVQAMAEAVAGRPGCDLVLKLHPREDPADYAFCATLDPPVRVIAQADMPDLIAASDLFVSSSSSTVLLAMMLDRPIVTVNFDAVPHFDQFEGIGGTLHVRTHEAFAEALGALLADPGAANRLARQRREVLARYTRFDGRATERIAALLADAIGKPAVIGAAAEVAV